MESLITASQKNETSRKARSTKYKGIKIVVGSIQYKELNYTYPKKIQVDTISKSGSIWHIKVHDRKKSRASQRVGS